MKKVIMCGKRMGGVLTITCVINNGKHTITMQKLKPLARERGGKSG